MPYKSFSDFLSHNIGVKFAFSGRRLRSEDASQLNAENVVGYNNRAVIEFFLFHLLLVSFISLL